MPVEAVAASSLIAAPESTPAFDELPHDLPQPPTAPPPVTYASLGGRALAAVLDGLAMIACYWVLGSLVAARGAGTTGAGFVLQGWPALVIIVGSLGAWLVFYVCFEWWFGATPGKWTAGLRVTARDGARLSAAQAVLRNLLRIVDGLAVYLVGAIAVLLTKKRQRLGDLVAGTVVVRRHTNPVLRAGAALLALALPAGAIGSGWYLGLLSASPSLLAVTAGTTAATPPGSGPEVGGAAPRGGAGSVMSATGTTASNATTFSDGPLTMIGVRLAASTDGPERASRAFKPGEAVVAQFAVSGTAAESVSAGHTRTRARVLDPFDAEVVQAMEHEDRLPTSQPVPSWIRFTLPEYCIPGRHRLEIVLEDLAAKRRLEASVPFVVEGAPYEPSDTLVLQSMHLTDGEGGNVRASTSYTRGGTVWMAFQAVGFKIGGGGAVKVTVDVSVTGRGGESVGELHLLTVDDKFFYAPRRIPMTAQLTLGQLPAGDYTATVRASDEVGQQRAQQAIAFTIAP